MSSKGFTLVEVIIAMAIFTWAMLIISLGFVDLSRSYQSGLAQRKAQEGSRAAMEEIVRQARDGYLLEGTAHTVCIYGSTKSAMYYVDSLYNLRSASFVSGGWGPPCNPASIAESPSDTIVAGPPAVSVVDISGTVSGSFPGPGGVCGSWNCITALQIDLKTASNTDPSIYDAVNKRCKPGASGYQYCSVFDLQSTVSVRPQL